MTPGVHPRIPGWRRPLPRRAGEAQFGTGPDGVIVVGVSETEARALTCLDGTRSVNATYVVAGRAGIPVRRWRELLDLVQHIGVLEPTTATTTGSAAASPSLSTATSPVGHERDSAHHSALERPIVVVGRPGTSAAVTGLVAALRRAGFDAGRGDTSLEHAIRLRGPERRRPAPLLAVMVDIAAIDPRRGDCWAAARVAHLPVLFDGSRSTVGPLVEPDLPTPCLWCLDLHRADRDAAWPSLASQLHTSDGSILQPQELTGLDEPALLDLVAGCVTLFARPVLSGTRPPTGVAVELSTPWPRMDHRRWQVHPRCSRHQQHLPSPTRTGPQDSRAQRPVVA